MRITVQFPSCDLRRFIKMSSGILEVPGWPAPTPNQEFVRGAGIIREDVAWGLEGWLSERFYCFAKRAIRFHQFHALPITPPFSASRAHLQLRIFKKSYFFDGAVVGKLEVGFELANKDYSEISMDIDSVIEHISTLKMATINNGKSLKEVQMCKFEYTDLALAGQSISRFLTAATSSKSDFENYEKNRKYVKPGRPLIYIELNDSNRFLLGRSIWKVDSPGFIDVKLYHGRRSILNRQDIPIWIVERGKKVTDRDYNVLKVFLLRLHAEHECLRGVLDGVQRGHIDPEPFSKESDLLQMYLNRATKNVLHLGKKFRIENSRKNMDEHSYHDAEVVARASLDHMQAGQRSALVERLRIISVRKNIKLKVEAYIEEDAQSASSLNLTVEKLVMSDQRQSITNSSNVSQTQSGRDAMVRLESSFSVAQGSDTRDTLIKELAELKQLLETAVGSGNLKEPDGLARDFEDLSRELAVAKPRKNKIQSSIEFIRDGVKGMTDLIQPVASTTKAILDIVDKLS